MKKMKFKIKIFLIVVFSILLNQTILAKESNSSKFSKAPEFYATQLSPDGKLLAILREIDDETKLTIVDLKTNQHVQTHEFVSKKEISGFAWLSSERLLFTTTISIGGDNRDFNTGDLYAVDVDGKNAIMLTGRQAKNRSDTTKDDPKKPAFIEDRLMDDPDHVMVSFRSSDPFYGLYKLNTNDGELTKIASSPVRYPNYVIDRKGVLLAVAGITPEWTSEIHLYNKNIPPEFMKARSLSSDVDTVEVKAKGRVKRKNSNWTYWKSVAVEESLEAISFNKDKGELITKEHGGSDKSGYYSTSLKTGERKLIYQHKVVDADSPLIDPYGNLYGSSLNNGYASYVFFKEKNEFKDIHKRLLAKFPGHRVSISSYSDDMNHFTFRISADNNPGTFLYYSKIEDSYRPIAKSRPHLNYDELAMTEPFSFKASDGHEVHGFFTPSLVGKPSESPTIINPHGGPEARDYWGYSSELQMFAAEGYNVVQTNIRGSEGYGLEHMRAVRGNWDGVLNDMFDGIDYLANAGVIDKNRMCIYGGSYGGYAATEGAMMRPALFKCSISNVGVYDLSALYDKGDIGSSRRGEAQLDIRLGTDKKRQKDMSPAFHPRRLQTPFFMIHGEKDNRAPFEEAERFSKILDKNGIKHKTFWIGKEGHGYADEDARKGVNDSILAFLDDHLKIK